MASNLPRALQEIAYEREAQAYLRSLPQEHLMEASPHLRQVAESRRLADQETRRADELQRRLEAAERDLATLRSRAANR